MTKGVAYHYYANPDREPIVCEVAGQYVWETGEPMVKYKSSYKGTFVRLIELTDDVMAALNGREQRMIDARFYYQTHDAEPLLVEIFDGYVNFLDGSVSKRIDTLPGTLVKLVPITPEFQEAVEEAIDLAGEAIPYAGAYFDGKWGLSERYEKASTVIRAWLESTGYAPAPAGDEGAV